MKYTSLVASVGAIIDRPLIAVLADSCGRSLTAPTLVVGEYSRIRK